MTQLTYPFNLQNDTAEDVLEVMQNFTAIQAIINGGLSNDNFMAGAALALTLLDDGGASVNQFLMWDGTQWEPVTFDNDRLEQDGAVLGQALIWDGAAWKPGRVFSADAVGVVPLAAKGFAGQTAALFEVRDSANNVVARITKDGFINLLRAVAGEALTVRRTADTFDRFSMDDSGRQAWGPGNAAADTNLYRSAVGQLKTDFSLEVTNDLHVIDDVDIDSDLNVDGIITSPNTPRILDRITAALSVVNTGVETSFYSFNVPANVLSTNRMLRLSLLGNYLNNSGSDKDVRLRIKWGGTTIFDDSVVNIVTSAIVRPLVWELMLANLGAANSQIVSSRAVVGTLAATTVGIGDAGADPFRDNLMASDADPAKDTTAQQTLELTVQHSAAHANTRIDRKYAVLELV